MHVHLVMRHYNEIFAETFHSHTTIFQNGVRKPSFVFTVIGLTLSAAHFLSGFIS